VLHDVYRGDWAITVPPAPELTELAAARSADIVAAFHVIQHGSATVTRDGHEWNLGRGDVFLALDPRGHVLGRPDTTVAPVALEDLVSAMPPAVNSEIISGDDTKVLCGVFVLERGELSPLRRHLSSDIHLVVAHRQRPEVTDTIRIPTAQSDPAWTFTTSRLLEVLLGEALVAHAALAPYVASLDEFVARSISIIDRDPTEPWTVQRLARACAVSPAWLSERFSATVGTTPMRYVLDRRMSLAAELLEGGTMSVERIGHHVGFTNQPAFSRAFKRHFGVPPSRWRSERRRTEHRRDPTTTRV
jgi:AraC-like DNA-binding protein